MSLEIIQPGLLTTVQDAGRRGYAAVGFQESGACDKYSLYLANLLAGNLACAGQAAALEFTVKGGEIRFSTREVIALAGADMRPALNGAPVGMYRPLLTEPGDVLHLGTAANGLRCYLAVYGGIAVPEFLGSRSTNLKCGIGGFHGRALRRRDVLRTSADRGVSPVDASAGLAAGISPYRGGRDALRRRLLADPDAFRLSESGEDFPRLPVRYEQKDGKSVLLLRTVPGPQSEAFTPEGLAVFTESVYRLSADCDRMACRLTGPPVESKNGCDIISDGIVEGSVQIASDGRPIVMMADHQTTGGYAKAGTVIGADIPALAQARPGDAVRFCFVTPQEGNRAYREIYERFKSLRDRLARG